MFGWIVNERSTFNVPFVSHLQHPEEPLCARVNFRPGHLAEPILFGT
jgi:hypothetical protein